MPSDDLINERIMLSGPRGRLSAELIYAADDVSAAALLIPPHPFMGGRMDNPVLTAISNTLATLGFVTMRFDYGGVADSEGDPVDIDSAMKEFWSTGTASQDPVLIEEAEVARRWLTDNAFEPVTPIGYSFGAYAAVQLMDQSTRNAILIAPTITQHDFRTTHARDAQLLVIHGEDDFATSQDTLNTWVSSHRVTPQVRSFPGANHFFRGLETEVADVCGRFVTTPYRNPGVNA